MGADGVDCAVPPPKVAAGAGAGVVCAPPKVAGAAAAGCAVFPKENAPVEGAAGTPGVAGAAVLPNEKLEVLFFIPGVAAAAGAPKLNIEHNVFVFQCVDLMVLSVNSNRCEIGGFAFHNNNVDPFPISMPAVPPPHSHVVPPT